MISFPVKIIQRDQENRTDLNVNVKVLNDRLKVSWGWYRWKARKPVRTNNISGNMSAEYQRGRKIFTKVFENDYEGDLYGYVIETLIIRHYYRL